MDENNQFYPASTDDDLLPVVDECDNLIEIMPRRQVHLGRLRHRAVEIGVVTPEGRVWLQKRSRAKDSWPGYWDLSATGHVDAGETYDQAACRELKEELGLVVRPAFVAKVEACERTGWEFQALYALRWAGAVAAFNPQEIEAMRAFTLEEIRELLTGASPLGRLTPCVGTHLPPILRALGLDPAPIELAYGPQGRESVQVSAWEAGQTVIGRETLPRGLRAVFNAEAIRGCIGEIFDAAREPKGVARSLKGIVYRLASEAETRLLWEKTGIAIEAGFAHVIDNYAIEHAMKQHGHPLTEAARGQMALTLEDFQEIPEITVPENVIATPVNHRGQQFLIYQKRYNGTTIVVEEVRNKRKQLAFSSMRKNKSGLGTTGEQLPEDQATSHTPEALRRPKPLSDSSIPPESPSVK